MASPRMRPVFARPLLHEPQQFLDALHAAARSRGFEFMPLPIETAVSLAADFAAEADRITA